jgi:hypothetical protein
MVVVGSRVTRAHAVPVFPLSGATPCVVGCSRLLRPPAPAATNSTRGTVINKQKTHKQEQSSQACEQVQRRALAALLRMPQTMRLGVVRNTAFFFSFWRIIVQ